MFTFETKLGINTELEIPLQNIRAFLFSTLGKVFDSRCCLNDCLKDP
jgi:hypothetical protein